MNPVAVLRHSWAATLALGLCMWAQIPHSQHVFEHWAKDQSGWAFAWGFEAAVLMFVVRNMHSASWTFASLSALINVGYYGLQGVQMWTFPNEGNWLNWLLSLALPFTIAMYSHVLADVSQDDGLHIPIWLQQCIAAVHSWVAPLRQRNAPPMQGGIVQPTVHPIAMTDATPMQEPAIDVQPATVGDAMPVENVQPDNAPCNDDVQPDPKEVAKQLKSEGLSNAQIAAQLGVNPSTVGRWMNGVAKVAA